MSTEAAPGPLGIEGFTREDAEYSGSRFSEVRDAVWANPYQKRWGAPGEPPLEQVTFRGLVPGVLPRIPWWFLRACKRTVASQADLRWGPDRKGFRRLLHPTGVCLTGLWEITEPTLYSGYFRQGSRGLVVARYSSSADTRRGRLRSLALVGRIYPTTDRGHEGRLATACFITQQDIGGEHSRTINEAVLRNAPNTTTYRRGLGAVALGVIGAAFTLAETRPTIRQVYQIAELGKPPEAPTWSPNFIQLSVDPRQPAIPGKDLDVRDEVMAQIYDPGDPAPKRSLVFRIETSDTGVTKGTPAIRQWREFTNWRQVGTITFTEAVVSYNGDHVLHFNHPRWRQNPNDPVTVFTK